MEKLISKNSLISYSRETWNPTCSTDGLREKDCTRSRQSIPNQWISNQEIFKGFLTDPTWTWFPKTSQPHRMPDGLPNRIPREYTLEKPWEYTRGRLSYPKETESRPKESTYILP